MCALHSCFYRVQETWLFYCLHSKSFNIVFSASIFIGGFTKKTECTKCQVLNFLIREANLAIYQACRNRVWDRNMCDVKDMREQNIKVRLRLEFCFHNASMNLEVFHQLWGHEDILSRATEQRQLEFTSLSLLKWNEWFLYIYKTINKVLLKVRKSLKMEKFSLSLHFCLSRWFCKSLL